MIANDKEGPRETAVKMIAAPVWVPVYCAYVGFQKLREALVKPKVAQDEGPSWMPATEVERAVYAALIIAGEPINNGRLAEMGCSPGEASKRVTRLEGAIRKTRIGREVLISLH